MAQDRFEIWLDQARATRPSGLRVSVSLTLSLILAFAGQVIFTILVVLLLVRSGAPISEFGQGVFMLLSFLGFWLAVFLVRLWLHGLPFSTIWGWNRRFEWRPFWAGAACALLGRLICMLPFGVYLALSGQAEAFLNPPEEPEMRLQEGYFWKGLVLLPLVILQSGAEEALFRGHMIQMLAARWRPLVWLWAGLPVAVFAAVHLVSVPGAAPGLLETQILFAAGMGVVCLAMTRAQGGISAAIGFHAMNNYLVFLALLLDGASLTPDSALEASPLPPLAMSVLLALYIGCCMWLFTARFLPFGRWIGLGR